MTKNIFTARAVEKIFLLAAIFLFALRIYLGRLCGVWFYPNSDFDDEWMVRAADFENYFSLQSVPFPFTLIKDMGFPLLLKIVQVSGIKYTDALSLLWLIAALLAVFISRELTREKNLLTSFLIFAFVLFTPSAFELSTGTRLYRNAALVPLYFIVFDLLIILFAAYFGKIFLRGRTRAALQIFLGIIFTWTFYFKEDGIWLLMCLLAVSSLCLAKMIFFDRYGLKNTILLTAIIILPLIIFSAGTAAYKSVNQKFFGVYLINNRTEGELGRFIKIIYKIKSDERNDRIWAPTDAILKAFDVSPTLKNSPALKERILHTDWFGGDIFKNPIRGDFLGWVTLSEIKNSGTCKSFAEQEIFFGKVNAELEQAFQSGKLQRDDKFQLTSSMGGKIFSRMIHLCKRVIQAYRVHLTTQFYFPGALPQDYTPYLQEFGVAPNSDYFKDFGDTIELLKNPKVTDFNAQAEKFTNMKISYVNPDAEKINRAVNLLFRFYAILQPILFLLAVIGMCRIFLKSLRRRIKFSDREFLIAIIAAGFLILSAVYAFAVAWFCEFVFTGNLPTLLVHLQFYGIGMIPMLMLFEIFGARLFFSAWR